MITVYGYVPAWGLPDISPYVTKLINYLTFTGQEFDYKNQDLGTLGTDSPTAKLPYIVDDDGTKVNDSTRIIQYLKQKNGDKLDQGMSAVDKAVALAFQRMVEEYTYWSGVIEPRWPTVERFEIYVPYITGGPGLRELPEEGAGALLAFREKIHDEHLKQGMGLRPHEDIVQCLKEDLDALSDFLGDKPYFMGDQVRSVDATIYSTFRHVADTPWDWAGRDHARSKTNLVAYADRLRDEFKVCGTAVVIDLYGYLGPNARKIVIALEELDLPYRVVWVDITAGEQFTPEFRAINPNAKVPAIIDHDGPDGRRIVLFESAAILLYLAEKGGRLLPADPERRWTAVSWLAWQVANHGPMSGQAAHFLRYAPDQGIELPYAQDRYRREVHRLYGLLDERLTGREYLADEFSVADIACFPWVRAVKGLGIDLAAEFPAVAAWSERIAARPSGKVRLSDPRDGRTENHTFTAQQFATLMHTGPEEGR